MGKLHEVLSVEDTVVSAAEKLLAETADKFHKHSEFFTGRIRTLKRLKDSEEDQAIENAGRQVKNLPSTVPATMGYVFPFLEKSLSLKLTKHLTNQTAKADIVLDGKTLATNVPVDFLLDLEKAIPKWRQLYIAMPTLDPSREWEEDNKGVWKSEAGKTVQTEKVMHPVILHPATDRHPAQVKESTKDVVVGTFSQTDFSGAVTSQQKADALTLCDKLLRAVKEARMRANSVEQVNGDAGQAVVGLFNDIFKG